jgi:hypothetical protein
MTLTQIVLAVVAALIIAFDVWTAAVHGAQTTVSWTLWTTAKEYPVIPLGIGIVIGHLFWVQQP